MPRSPDFNSIWPLVETCQIIVPVVTSCNVGEIQGVGGERAQNFFGIPVRGQQSHIYFHNQTQSLVYICPFGGSNGFPDSSTIILPLTAPNSMNPARKDVARRILPEIDISPLGEKWPLGTGFAPHPLPLRGVSIPRVAKNYQQFRVPPLNTLATTKSIPPITTQELFS